MRNAEKICSECLILQKEEMEYPYLCEGCEKETKYVAILWVNGDPLIDGSDYFDTKEECLAHIKWVEAIIKNSRVLANNRMTMCTVVKYKG